jgi:hypothetical protein
MRCLATAWVPGWRMNWRTRCSRLGWRRPCICLHPATGGSAQGGVQCAAAGIGYPGCPPHSYYVCAVTVPAVMCVLRHKPLCLLMEVVCRCHAACRAPCLSGKQHDVDPVVMHRLSCGELYPAMERRYGANPALVGCNSSTAVLHMSALTKLQCINPDALVVSPLLLLLARVALHCRPLSGNPAHATRSAMGAARHCYAVPAGSSQGAGADVPHAARRLPGG